MIPIHLVRQVNVLKKAQRIRYLVMLYFKYFIQKKSADKLKKINIVSVHTHVPMYHVDAMVKKNRTDK
jgi:hypothetical protein